MDVANLRDINLNPEVVLAPTGTEAGAELLDETHDTLASYVVWPSYAVADAFTLWVAATHAQAAWEHATRFVLKSPIKRCGKTRAQELARELVHNALASTNISVAALVRSISEDDPPTLILDEADTVFGKKLDRTDGAEDLRGILNSGHSRGWPYIRWDASSRCRDECPTFAMALIGGIGDLPDTIEDRSVVSSMRRRAPGEPVRPFRRRRVVPELHRLRDRLHAWASGHVDTLTQAEPDLPVEDRAADVWEPLAAIADLAGGDWPERARRACVELTGSTATDEGTAGERLLADIHDIWGDEGHLFTATILERLHSIEEAPWADWFGRPLSARGLAKLLKPYGVSSKSVRIGEETAKGYVRADLADSWRRYVTSVTPSRPAEPAGPTSENTRDVCVTDADFANVTGSDQDKQPSCDAVTDVAGACRKRATESAAAGDFDDDPTLRVTPAPVAEVEARRLLDTELGAAVVEDVAR